MSRPPEDRLIRSIEHLPGGYTLHLYATGKLPPPGFARDFLGYRLEDATGEAVFEGEDFGPSPLHAYDSDETLAALLTFLTLRPGDTDAAYFADYTERQWAFVEEDAEELARLVSEVEQGYRAFPDVERALNGSESIEVFEMTLEDVLSLGEDSNFHDEDTGEPLPGWYFWHCLPGCLPDSDPVGPFETRAIAYREAYDYFELWDK